MFVFREIYEKEASFQAAVRDWESWIPLQDYHGNQFPPT